MLIVLMYRSEIIIIQLKKITSQDVGMAQFIFVTFVTA